MCGAQDAGVKQQLRLPQLLIESNLAARSKRHLDRRGDDGAGYQKAYQHADHQCSTSFVPFPTRHE